MLVFIIHGVATRDVKYADSLKTSIKQTFNKMGEDLPHFFTSFWGNALNDVNKIWNWINQDLQELKRQSTGTDPQDAFRYQQFREGFLSEFVGDAFAYLSPKRGVEIRRLLARQLFTLLEDYPEEDELHIISHSLGTVLLWDILFSERFSLDDPALEIRSLFDGSNSNFQQRKIKLRSITTMGAPILFFNTMLGVKPENIKDFVNRQQSPVLSWLNIIHASDIIAYPLKSSINLDSFRRLKLRDVYITTDTNLVEKAARSLGQFEAAVALGAGEAHSNYWNCQQVSQLVVGNLLGDKKRQEYQTILYKLFVS